MKRVELYTLNRSQLPASIGDYVSFTRWRARPNTRVIPVSGTGYMDYELAEVPEERAACKVYRMCETGKPDRLVAIDPDLVDTIKFVALGKVTEQLSDEKFRVQDLSTKLANAEHMLKRAYQKSDDLVAECHRLEYELPIWKLLRNRFLNWYTN